MPGWTRMIGHVDMDSFYASVEVRDDPGLAGLPLVVGGDARRRGVVSSASYEARKFGVRSAMPMATAHRLCPDLVVVSGDMRKYQDVSRSLRAIFFDFSPLVEPLSLDEAFLDLTGTQRLLGDARRIGEAIRSRISSQLSLTGSVGISNSKYVAKLASDHDKPDGLTIVPPDGVESFVQSLPLERLWGAGPATLRALHAAGIRTMKRLADADPVTLTRALGKSAPRFIELARGHDERDVVPEAPAKSVSHEVTFAEDQKDEGILEGVLLGLTEKVGRRARSAGVRGRTITLKLRRPDFQTFTRSRTLSAPTCATGQIFEIARELFRKFDRGGVRLLGVGLSSLTESVQLEMSLETDSSQDSERQEDLEKAEDAVVERFGRKALARASTLLEAETTGAFSDRIEDDRDE